MRDFEQEKRFEAASVGRITELYWLVQQGLEQHEAQGDEVSQAVSFGRYNQDGMYLGYVEIESMNPLYPTNTIGVCSIIHTGDLEQGVPLQPEDMETKRDLNHLIRNYYIHYSGPKLAIVKSTNIKKPNEVDTKTEVEDLVELSDLNDSLSVVYEDEIEEVIAKVKKATRLP